MLYALPLCDLYIMSFDSPKKQKTVKDAGAPNESLAQNHLNIALLNVF